MLNRFNPHHSLRKGKENEGNGIADGAKQKHIEQKEKNDGSGVAVAKQGLFEQVVPEGNKAIATLPSTHSA